jgi:gamma-glutamyltranspeptidase/glutathione hydrolase
VDIGPDWTEGFITAIQFNEDTGVLEAGVDPRGSKSEAFPQWACVW